MFQRNQRVIFRSEFRQRSTVIPQGMTATVSSVNSNGDVSVAFEGRTVPLYGGSEATGFTIPAAEVPDILVALPGEVAA